MKILGVNGIRSDGHKTTDRMLNALANLGYKTKEVEQPKRSAIGARFKYRQDAKAILDIAEPGDVLITHSYGGLKAAIAMKQMEFSAVFMFRPAMSRRYKFNQPVYCIYSPHDMAIWLGGGLLLHPFGWAGVKGFKSKHATNIPSSGHHGADFEGWNLVRWMEFIDNKLQKL